MVNSRADGGEQNCVVQRPDEVVQIISSATDFPGHARQFAIHVIDKYGQHEKESRDMLHYRSARSETPSGRDTQREADSGHDIGM